jgi:hypothetical protein
MRPGSTEANVADVDHSLFGVHTAAGKEPVAFEAQMEAEAHMEAEARMEAEACMEAEAHMEGVVCTEAAAGMVHGVGCYDCRRMGAEFGAAGVPIPRH